MERKFTILDISGPYREPRDLVFSFDYSIQRPHWPTPNGVRIKVSIPDELDYLKQKILGIGDEGTGGQQLIMSRTLTRRIADQKMQIVDEEGMLAARLDVLIEPFTGTLEHLFPKLESWMIEKKETLRKEIFEHVGL